MSLNLTEKSKIQIYPNEFIGHNVINRSLLRLYDNDIIIYNSLTNSINVTSGILELEINALDVRVAANEAQLNSLDLSGINTAVEAGSANWDWTYGIVNSNYNSWDSVYTTVNTTSGIWSGSGGSTTFSGLIDTDANPAFLNNGDLLQWSDALQKWIATGGGTGIYTTFGDTSSIVETYDNVREWTAHGNNSISDRKHLTNDWENALSQASNPAVNNPIVTANDLTPLYSINNFVRYQDVKNSGVDGGDFTSGARRQREINVEINNTIDGLYLGTNEFYAPSGAYYVEADCTVGGAVGPHKAWLYDDTGTVDLLSGQVSNGLNTATIKGVFEIEVSSVIQIQHQCTNTVTTSGFGEACGFGDPEVYTDIRVWRFEESVDVV